MRTIQSPIFVELYKAFGAIPVPMAWPECYVGLKQGTIDGVDSILAYGYPMKHHEVTKFVTITHHVYSPAPFIVSEKWWQSLPSDLKDIITQAEVEARAIERKADIRLTAEAAKKWEDYGVQVIRNPKLDEFRKIALSIYPNFESKLGKENMDWIIELGEVPEGAENP
jgi:TRAP-type C4-dicarboxylate transport system substrate-binding protein